VNVVCCQVEVSATDWSLVQRSPTDCGVPEYDHEPPRKGGSLPGNGSKRHRKLKKLIFGEKCNYEAPLYAVFSSLSYLSICCEFEMKPLENAAREGHCVPSLTQIRSALFRDFTQRMMAHCQSTLHKTLKSTDLSYNAVEPWNHA
jgi:hypothetical protein